jgi:OOP family OmpA-OmpF porin|nr:OmpA family protein [uncultured Flavobacterium sp.]
MSRKIIYLLGIAITIILGTFLYLKFCCNCCEGYSKSNPKIGTETTPSVSVTAVDTLSGKIRASVDSLSVISKTDWISTKEKFNANPLILYFETSKSNEDLTTEELQKVADLVNYSKNVADATFLIVGYSDNVGSRKSNIILGKNRAEFAKSYLVQKGIDGNKIITQSKGPDEPIADNTTDVGRAKNRRTVITIQ